MKTLEKYAIAIIFMVGILYQSNVYATGARAMFYDPSLNVPLLAQDLLPKKEVQAQKIAQKKPDNTKLATLAKTPSSKTTNTGLRYWIELQQANETTSYKVDPNRVFRSGDRVRLHFAANQDGFLYITQHGSTGVKKLLFPVIANSSENMLKAGVDLPAPEPGWFKFDATAGEEQLDVMFYPATGDPKILNRLKSKQTAKTDLEMQVQQMITSNLNSRDLVLEIDNTYFEKYSGTIGAPATQPLPQLGQMPIDVAPPAVYAVNTKQGEHAQPVTLNIVLHHSP